MGRQLRWLPALAGLAIVLSSCGGAKSAGGTSAANCVNPLQKALLRAPSADEFRGLAQVGKEQMQRLGFTHVSTSGKYCVVMFSNTKLSNKHLFVMDLYGYSEWNASYLGHVRHSRHARRLLDLG